MQLFVWIPGILGSRLRRADGGEIWPPSPTAVDGLDDRTFAQLTDRNLLVAGPIGSVCEIVQVYSPLEALFDQARVPVYNPAAPAPRARLGFGYDWRMDIESQASLLADQLDKIIKDPGDEIVFVAHSMGNYLCRYLIETDVFANRFFNEHRCVKKLVSVNGPQAGAPVIIARMLGLDKMDHVAPADVPKLLACPPFAAACELLPAPDRAHFFEGQTPIDLYDPATVERFGWGAANVEKAKQFWAKIGAQRKADGVDYVIVRSYLEDQDGKGSTIANVRLTDQGLTVEWGPGDGAVPPWSAEALGPADVVLPGEHVGVFATGQFASDVFDAHIAKLIDFPGLQPVIRLQPVTRDLPANGKARFALVQQDLSNRATSFWGHAVWRLLDSKGAIDQSQPPFKDLLQINDLGEAMVVQLKVPARPGAYQVQLEGLIDDEEMEVRPITGVVVSVQQPPPLPTP